MVTKKLTPELLNEMIREVLEERSGQKKKTCTSRKDGRGHNRFHNADGEFSSKANAKSSSVRNPQSTDCKYAGQSRLPGERILKRPCGRKTPENPNQKGKFKCKDGSLAEENDDGYVGLLDEPTYPNELTQLGQGMTEDKLASSKINVEPDWRTKYQQFVSSLTPDEQREVKKTICSYNPITMAKLINQFAKALDGKLDEPGK